MMKYTPYSHHKLSVYNRCPLRWALQYIAKCLPWDDNAVFERGNYFHWRLRHYPENPEFGFRFASKKQVAEYERKFDEIIQSPLFRNVIFKKRANTDYAREYPFFLDQNFGLLYSKDNAMFLGSIDYICRTSEDSVFIVDYKTGSSEGDQFQLEVYAVWAMCAYKVETVYCSFVYLDEDRYTKCVFTRDDLERLQLKIINKINTIEADTEFDANAGDHCQKCPGYKICQSQMKE